MGATVDNVASSPAQVHEVMRTNRVLGAQALVYCREDAMVRLLTLVLSDLGFAPRICEEAEGALAALNASFFDLVVVDCEGTERGMALLPLVRRATANKRPTLLALVEAPSRINTAFRLGATLALSQPFSVSLLKPVLRASQGNILRQQRRAYRHPVEIPVSVSLEHAREWTATAINLSETGLAIQLPRPLQVNQPVSVTFDLPDTNRSVEAKGVVTWLDRTGKAGIAFQEIRPLVRRMIEEWLQGRFERMLTEKKTESEIPVPAHLLAPNDCSLELALEAHGFWDE